MTGRKVRGGKQVASKKPLTLKAQAPKVDEAVNFHRQRIEAILRHRQSLDSAKELLGCDIVAVTADGPQRVRITKTRSFDGVGGRSTNRERMEQEAGRVLIMKYRVAKFLNVTTGREGNPTCVWIEEATDMKTGKILKSNQLLKTLGLGDSDGKPIFSKRTAIVPGQKPAAVIGLNPGAERASSNTTGVFQAVFDTGL